MRRRPWAAARSEEQDLVLAIEAAVGRTPAERPFFVDVSDPATQSEACRRPAHQVLSAAALLGPCLGLESLCCRATWVPAALPLRALDALAAGLRPQASASVRLERAGWGGVCLNLGANLRHYSRRVPGQRTTPCPRGDLCGSSSH